MYADSNSFKRSCTWTWQYKRRLETQDKITAQYFSDAAWENERRSSEPRHRKQVQSM